MQNSFKIILHAELEREAEIMKEKVSDRCGRSTNQLATLQTEGWGTKMLVEEIAGNLQDHC